MRLTAATRRKAPHRANAKSDSVPASIGGWDTISPVSAMKPDHAMQLDNFIPQPGWIEPRKGYTAWGTSVGTGTAKVETLMAYNGVASNKLFAIAGGTIYDVTVQGVAVATTVTGMLNSRWQYINWTNSAGTKYLIAANGADTPKIYDGSTWADLAVTGLTMTSIIQPFIYKSRLWFAMINSTETFYLAVGAIAGAATSFQVGQFMREGGYVNALASWTIDTRQSVDDYMAFISSRGQVVVYTGTDPSSSTTWTLVGVYNIGRPVGRRCWLKIAGDLAIITTDGISSMNALLSTDRAAANRNSVSLYIGQAMNDALNMYGTNFGWQLIEYPLGSLAILNVPTTTNSAAQQYVMNIITGAWCRFLSINANCWELLDDNIYFGGNDGKVYKWDYGASDNGANISCTCRTAFNYFRDREHVKRFTMVRPVITTSAQVTPGVGIDVDFGTGGLVSTPVAQSNSGPFWDLAVWDSAVWPIESAVSANWSSLAGLGRCASIITQVVTSDTGSAAGVTCQINSWDIVYETGGILG